MPNLVRIGPTVWISIPDTHTHKNSTLYIRSFDKLHKKLMTIPSEGKNWPSSPQKTYKMSSQEASSSATCVVTKIGVSLFIRYLWNKPRHWRAVYSSMPIVNSWGDVLNWNGHLKNGFHELVFTPGAQRYKTFYVRNLWIFIIECLLE